MFGHTVALNFKKSGNTRNTKIGGFFSLLAKAFLIYYISYIFYKFFSRSDPNNVVIPTFVDVDEVGEVKFNDTRVYPFWVLKKQTSNINGLNIADMKSYLDVYVEHRMTDWSKPNDKGRYKSVKYEVEQCTQEHFGEGEALKKYFESWYGMMLVCMKKEDFSKVSIRGDQSSMITDNFVFKVEICTKENCKNDEEIHKYIRDLQIDIWIIQEKMNFQNFKDERPIFLVMENWARVLVDKDSSKVMNLYVKKNEIENFDNPIELVSATFEDLSWEIGYTQTDTYLQAGY